MVPRPFGDVLSDVRAARDSAAARALAPLLVAPLLPLLPPPAGDDSWREEDASSSPPSPPAPSLDAALGAAAAAVVVVRFRIRARPSSEQPPGGVRGPRSDVAEQQQRVLHLEQGPRGGG